MSKKAGATLIAAAFLGLAIPAAASSRLFYLEFQALAGYSSAAKKAVFYSWSQEEVMQKPSLGFDLVQRISGRSGDIAVIGLQARLAWNAEGERALEPQIFNAFLRLKLGWFDLWVGHDRPRFGLSAVLDSHGLLLQPLAMSGFGFDRDWGIGIERDLDWGTVGLSATTGSGMALALEGNYFLAARIARGDLARDNASGGFSVGYGKLLDVMGVEKLSSGLREFAMAAIDLSWIRDNRENRLELIGGGLDSAGAFAASWRVGFGLLEENRLKLEAQPAFILINKTTQVDLSLGASYIAHPDWTLRTMLTYNTERKDARLVFQVYYYKGIGL